MRKCWNCGQPIDDDNSRVCSDEICQRAEKKSSNGEFRNEGVVRQHERWRKRDREYNQRPEVKAKKRKRRQSPEYKARVRERSQSPEYKAKARERNRKYKQRPENKAKAREYYQRKKKPTQRQPSQKRLRVVSAPESRERMKKAMQDLGMTEELKLFFGEE